MIFTYKMYGKKEHCQLKREREFNYTTITQINQRGVSKRCIHYADNMVMKLLDHCSSIWICWTINLDLCLSNLFKLTYNIKKEWSQCYRKGQGQQIGIWLISSYLYGSLKLYGNLVKCIKNKIFMWKSLGRSGSENYDTFQLLPFIQVTL